MDTVALTYVELADRLSVKVASARKMVQRHKWKRVAGNDGLVRIEVPIEVLPAPRSRPSDSPLDSPSDSLTDIVPVLEAQISALKELVAAERGRADMAQRMASEAMVDRDRWHQLATRPWYRRLVG